VGLNAGYASKTSYNTFVGENSGRFTTTGASNAFLGRRSGYRNTTGKRNTYMGVNAGYNGKIGEDNTFMGVNTGYDNLADFNTFIGGVAGRYNTTGADNTFIGRAAGYLNKTGSDNTFVGVDAGYNTTADFNTFLGKSAGKSNTSGTHNVFVGMSAGQQNNDGIKNTCVGLAAGRNNVAGDGNVFLGYAAGIDETGSDKLYIHNTGGAPLIYGDFSSEYVGIAIDPAADIVSPTDYGLYVGKGILAEKVKVATRGTANWADYVFEADYDLNSTEEVEAFIQENKHLPNVPSAKEVNENGIDMVEMDATLLRQIEELWLHVIELKKENEALNAKLEQK